MIGEEDGVGLTVTDQLLADRAVVGQLQLVVVAAVLHPKQKAKRLQCTKTWLLLFGEGGNKYSSGGVKRTSKYEKSSEKTNMKWRKRA
jgi:hypothetical protein